VISKFQKAIRGGRSKACVVLTGAIIRSFAVRLKGKFSRKKFLRAGGLDNINRGKFC
jgi:hypothetical protein